MMRSLPKRRKRPKMGCKASSMIRSRGHEQWIRGMTCSVAGRLDPCSGRIEAAHVRTRTDGGEGLKPSDCWLIPLCFHHHETVQHTIGEPEFERRYKIDMKEIAAGLWAKSPQSRKFNQAAE